MFRSTQQQSPGCPAPPALVHSSAGRKRSASIAVGMIRTLPAVLQRPLRQKAVSREYHVGAADKPTDHARTEGVVQPYRVVDIDDERTLEHKRQIVATWRKAALKPSHIGAMAPSTPGTRNATFSND